MHKINKTTQFLKTKDQYKLEGFKKKVEDLQKDKHLKRFKFNNT